MSNYSTVDRESFQNVLASAFAVQQMDSQSLSAFVQVGRLVTRGDLNVEQAVRLISDRTQNPANTTGVAIDQSSGTQLALPRLEEDDRSSAVFLSHLASTLPAHGAGAVSADIALDLALNNIAEQACLATKAGAAAIALVRGEEMVCRASTGKSALELGVLLDARAGLSSNCTQTREAQCCADTEADSHIDAVACRRLGIRSFLIFPLLKQGELVGLFEIYSPRPQAFGEPEIQTLRVLSRQVLIQIDCAIERSTPPPGDEPSTAADSMDACVTTSPIRPPEEKTAQFGLRDPWTTLQLILVIALALLLGWMLVRVTWRGTAHRQGAPTVVSAKPDAAPPQFEKTRQVEPSPPPHPVPPQAKGPETPSDSLVISQDGKVIFRLKPSQAHRESTAPDSALESPGKVTARLLRRVEPQYPEAARHQHIQGPVVLEAKVGKDGEVQQIAVISGNSMLATAASDAVLKWRFKPLVQNGRAMRFQTRITFDFVLP
jgi:TonB family protein